MKKFYTGQQLGTALIAEGLCPANARAVELYVPADGAVFLRYELFLESADLPKIARALLSLDEAATSADAARLRDLVADMRKWVEASSHRSVSVEKIDKWATALAVLVRSADEATKEPQPRQPSAEADEPTGGERP